MSFYIRLNNFDEFFVTFFCILKKVEENDFLYSFNTFDEF